MLELKGAGLRCGRGRGYGAEEAGLRQLSRGEVSFLVPLLLLDF